MTALLSGYDSARPSAARGPSRVSRAAAATVLLASLGACSPAAAPSASPGSTPNPATVPTASPTAAAGLDHPTGATDVVLRFEESGGFVPIEYNATYAPSFTLYGDGSLVFRDPYAPAPEGTDNVVRAVPFMIAKLDEASVQALLDEALGAGGLAIAQGPYMCNCADIPTSTFTIAIGGKTKRVSVTGLSPDVHDKDKQVVTALAAFAERLRTFADVLGNEQPYVPAGYRGILIEVEQPAGPVVAWPWPRQISPAARTSSSRPGTSRRQRSSRSGSRTSPAASSASRSGPRTRSTRSPCGRCFRTRSSSGRADQPAAPIGPLDSTDRTIGSRRRSSVGVIIVREMVGTSPRSWSDAARQAVATAARTVRNIKTVEVVKSTAVVEDGEIVEYRVDLKIGFEYEG